MSILQQHAMALINKQKPTSQRWDPAAATARIDKAVAAIGQVLTPAVNDWAKQNIPDHTNTLAKMMDDVDRAYDTADPAAFESALKANWRYVNWLAQKYVESKLGQQIPWPDET